MERPTNSRKLFSKIIGMESKTASRVQLLATLFFSILSLFLVTNSLKLQPTDHQCLQSMNSWSPALDSVRYHWETFQNGFARKTNYKGPPLVETEAAWDNLRQETPLEIPASKLPELQQPIERDWALTSPSHSNGVQGHLSVFRQIDCLSLLRRHTYRNEHDYASLPEFQGSEMQIMSRVDKCVQHLRHTLMCAADATPYLIKLNPKRPSGEGPDFDTLHYCRNFEELREWAGVNSVRV